jgi:hypothetical protein
LDIFSVFHIFFQFAPVAHRAALGVRATLFDMSKLQAPIITGLVLAAVSGLTILAYDNPDGYERLSPWVSGAFGLCICVIGLFVAGMWAGYVILVPFILRDKHEEARAVLGRYCSPRWFFICSIAGSIFFSALHGLRYISPQKSVETKPTTTQNQLPSHKP